ncbi:MAG: beta-ketoacyl-ACP synthase, partial [Hyphomicrobiales bacterium]
MNSTLDSRGRPVVVVTGIGVVSSLGEGVDANWTALTEGRSGIHAITRFPTDHLRTTIAGTVDFMDVSPVTGIDLSFALARSAGLEAVRMAGYDGAFAGPLFLAAPPIELEWQHRFLLDALPGEAREEAGYDRLMELVRQNRDPAMYRQTLFSGISERLADILGTRGLPVTLSTACASGASAIQLGVEAIRRGETDRAISIGTDGSVGAEALIRFSLLSALSTNNAVPARASKP